MKATPKSCSCNQCKHYSDIKAKKRTKEERAFRRAAKVALEQGKEDILPAPHGDYLA